jgi:hypothetical protein
MWKWIKIPNVGAFVAFFLPWLTVSCSGTPIGTATGWQLAFGGYSASHQFGADASASGPQGNGWLMLALIAILFGIVLAFLKQSRKTSIKAGWSAACALAFILLGTVRYSKASLVAQASANSDKGFGGSIDQAALAMVQVTWEIGYWIAIIALIASGLMSWLAYSESGLSIETGSMQIRTNKPG